MTSLHDPRVPCCGRDAADCDCPPSPTLSDMRLTRGVAGQIAVDVTVKYRGEEPERLGFVGSSFGGPVVMILPSGRQMFVTNPERHGDFGTEWVRRFFS